MTISYNVGCHTVCTLLPSMVLLAVIALAQLPQRVSGDDWSVNCSSNCTCKWTNGKKSAICSSLQLTTIPTTLSTELQVLVFNDNHIPYLNREEFTHLGLLNLQRIYLKKSDIQYIHKDTFKNLKILVEIDLSDNKIEMLDKDTFMGNDRLRILYLNGNPLKKLVAYQFPILPHLRTLDLHNCLISYIDPMALANLNMLEFLYLKNNLLESLSEYVFQHMTNLKTLVIDDNPWQCNCKLRKFRNWYVHSKVNSISLLCKGPPAQKENTWDMVDEEQFGCIPKVEIFNNEDVQNIDIGSNATFSCLIYGDPLPEVTWELNGKIIDNDNVLFDVETLSVDKLWSNLTVFNMTSLDAGTYACIGVNIVGAASQNISIYLTEIVQHVLVKTPETFWYFGLIMGTFGTVFLLILISFVVCLCKRTSRQRRHSKKSGVKTSVSFNDQEKKLLDLSITTTTADRGDSCGIDNNTTNSLSKTESVIAFEPIEIHTSDNHRNNNGHTHGHGSLMLAPNHHQHQQVQQHHVHISNISNAAGGGGGMNGGGAANRQQLMAAADGTCNIVSVPTSMAASIATGCHPDTIPEEFPLNVNVFPPPPEFCSNIVPNPAYGNIFISVSVTQDMLDGADLNMYPDLLNIPNRLQDSVTSNANGNCTSATAAAAVAVAAAAAAAGGGAIPLVPTSVNAVVPSVNISSFATLPRNTQRRSILKKESSLQHTHTQQQPSNQTQTNQNAAALYAHDELIAYHNLETDYIPDYDDHHHHHHHDQQQQQQQQHQHQHQQHQQESQNKKHPANMISLPPPPSSSPTENSSLAAAAAAAAAVTSSCCHHNQTPGGVGTTCAICLNLLSPPSVCSTPPIEATPLRPLCKGSTSAAAGTGLLKYDNMGKRITASGNSTLSLPDEERLENETLFIEETARTNSLMANATPRSASPTLVISANLKQLTQAAATSNTTNSNTSNTNNSTTNNTCKPQDCHQQQQRQQNTNANVDSGGGLEYVSL